MKTILDELKSRGIFQDITNVDKFNKLKKGAGIYIGFDPTGKSLHLGNYIQIAILKRWKEYGFNPIAVLGGATGMIGDPSGKTQERVLISEDELLDNKVRIRKQLESFGFEVVDNLEFYKNMSIIEFLRDVGKYININYMLNKDVVSSRIDTGISYTEFSYQLIQGWDFKILYETKDVHIQMGGSDQWGNITGGIELIRKTHGDDNTALGIIAPLLVTSSGKKFGKSEGNAIWIDSELTTPFQMYQHLLNWEDADILKLLKWLTFLSVDEIDKIYETHLTNPSERLAQKTLAYEVIKDIHGKEEAEEAIEITNILFGSGDIKKLSPKQLKNLEGALPLTTKKIEATNIVDVLIEIGVCHSKREARELVVGNSIEFNGDQINDVNQIIKNDLYDGKYSILKKGKRNYFLIKNN